MTGIQERTLGVLLGVAAKRGTITYTALGRILGLKMEWARDRAILGEHLGAVADYGRAEWGILLPSVAVGKGDNMPSGRTDPANPSGFYSWCQQHGVDISNPHKLVIDEQRKAYNFAAG
jgi:hypothetical protein